MKEFYRSSEEINKIIIDAARLNLPYPEFKALLARYAIDSTISPSNDRAESLLKCIEAGITGRYNFNLLQEDEKNLMHEHGETEPSNKTIGKFFEKKYPDLGPLKFKFTIVNYFDDKDPKPETDKVIEEYHYGYRASKGESATISICLIKQKERFAILNGAEYFSQDKNTYFLKIGEYLSAHELKPAIENMLREAQRNLTLKKTGQVLINRLVQIRTPTDLKNIFSSNSFLIDQFCKLFDQVDSKQAKAVLNQTTVNSLNVIKAFYAEQANQALLKLKAENELKNQCLKAVDLKNNMRFFFKKSEYADDVVQSLLDRYQLAKPKILDYFQELLKNNISLSDSIKQDIKQNKLNINTLVTYFEHNGIVTFPIWTKIPGTKNLNRIPGSVESCLDASFHLLQEGEKYILLKEEVAFREKYKNEAEVEQAQAVPSVWEVREEVISLKKLKEDPKFKSSFEKLTEIRLFATRMLEIDDSIECWGKSIVLCAPKVVVRGCQEISTSGRSSVQTLGNGLSGVEKRRDKNSPEGLSGEPGACGEPGESAGHIYIQATDIENLKNLNLKLNGGNGANGTNGGDGDEGRAGKNGENANSDNPSSVFDLRTKYIIQKGKKGEAGQDGGAGGFAGRGGKGGRPGQVQIMCAGISKNDRENFVKNNIENIPGQDGQDGRCGKGGKGGKDGVNGLDQGFAWKGYIFTKTVVGPEYGNHLLVVEHEVTSKEHPLRYSFKSAAEDSAAQETSSSISGKSGDELPRQPTAKEAKIILPPFHREDDALSESDCDLHQSTEIGRNAKSLKQEYDEVCSFINKAFVRMQPIKEENKSKTLASFKQSLRQQKTKPLPRVALTIQSTKAEWAKIEKDKDDILKKFEMFEDNAILSSVEHILEVVSLEAPEYFSACKTFLMSLAEKTPPLEINRLNLFYSIENLRYDIFWLSRLSVDEKNKLKKLFDPGLFSKMARGMKAFAGYMISSEKREITRSQEESLLKKLQDFRGHSLSLEDIESFFTDPELNFFHDVVKDKIVSEITKHRADSWYLKLIGKAASPEEYIALKKLYSSIFESHSSGFIDAYEDYLNNDLDLERDPEVDRQSLDVQDDYEAKCFSYIKRQSLINLSSEFEQLLLSIEDKKAVFEMLIRKRPKNWVKELLLLRLHELLSTFIEHENIVGQYVEQFRSSLNNETLLAILNNKLEEEILTIRKELRFSAKNLNVLLKVVLSNVVTPEILRKCNQRPLFFWKGVFKKQHTLESRWNTRFDSQIASIKAYRKKIENYSEEDLKKWCEDPAHLNSAWIKENSIEVLAIISQAVWLTQKYYPYDTQYFALLSLIEGGAQAKGVLGLVATSEGKTLITAMFAIYNVLLKKNVDIISSSSVLAQRDATANNTLFNVMNIKVSCNCKDGGSDDLDKRQNVYQAHVVYGDVGSFERDYLLSKHTAQMVVNRKTDVCFIDEADSMLLDKAEHVLYLSHEMNDFRHLRSLYIEIWSLYQNTHAIQDDQQRKKYIQKQIEEKISKGILQFPNALNAFVERRLSLWITNAFIADRIHLNDPYALGSNNATDKKEKVIVIDKDTGVEQYNMTWENGLHQFLELKHQKKLSMESLKSIYISNFAYLKQFKGKIYGLSGTLGSESEQTLLSNIYDVDFFSVPRRQPRKFHKEEAIVVPEDSQELWFQAIEKDVEEKANKGRPILVLCENIEAAKAIKRRLKSTYRDKIYSYSKTTKKLKFLDESAPCPMGSGDIIIATNLAGRGTHLNIDDQARKNGGLHIVMTHMPANARIEEQNFSRAARKEQPGTGRMIIRSEFKTIDEACEERDIIEEKRLQEFRQNGLQSLLLEEELSQRFNAFSKHVSKALTDETTGKNKTEITAVYLKSLQDRWALWLDEKRGKIENAVQEWDSVIHDYEIWQAEIKRSLDNKAARLAFIAFPHELIQLGLIYINSKEFALAEACFKKVIELEPKFSEIARIYLVYVLSQENQRFLLKNHDNNPIIRKEIYHHLKAAKKLIEKRLRDINELTTKRQIAADIQSSFGCGLSSNEIDEQLLNEAKLLTAHLDAIKRITGERVDQTLLSTLNQLGKEENATALFEILAKTEIKSGDRLIKPMRISQKVVVEGNKIFIKKNKIGTDMEAVSLPQSSLKVLDKVVNVIQSKIKSGDLSLSSSEMAEGSEVWIALHKAGVVKDSTTNLTLAHAASTSEINKRIDEIEGRIEKIVEQFFSERDESEAKAKAEEDKKNQKELSLASSVKKTLGKPVVKILDYVEKTSRNKKYVNNIMTAIKMAAGNIKAIPKFKIEFDAIEKYFETGEIPPEIYDFQKMIFDQLIIMDFDKSLWSWEAFAVAMFGVAQLAAGVALQVSTFGVGALFGAVLISEGIGDIIYAIQSGLAGTFSWKEYFFRKALSLSINILFAGVGGAISGTFAAGSGVIAMPGKEIAKQIGIEFGCRLAVTVGSSLAFMALEQLMMQLPAEISLRFGKKIQRSLMKALMAGELKTRLAESLSALYRKEGIKAGNKKVEALLGEIQNDKSWTSTFSSVLFQFSTDCVLQVFQVLEHTNIGNGAVNWALLNRLTRICIETGLDIYRAKKIVDMIKEKFEALPDKIMDYAENSFETKGAHLSEAEISQASEQFIQDEHKKASNEIVNRIVGDVLKPRLQSHLSRTFRMLSANASTVAQKFIPMSGADLETDEVNLEVGEQGAEAVDAINSGTAQELPGTHHPAHNSQGTTSHNGQPSHHSDAKAIATLGIHPKPHVNVNASHHHVVPSSEWIMCEAITTGSNVLKTGIELIRLEYIKMTKYRIACIELEIKRVRLETLQKIKADKAALKQYKADVETALQTRAEIDALKTEMEQIEITVKNLAMAVVLDFSVALKGLNLTGEKQVEWIQCRLQISQQIRKEFAFSETRACALVREIVKEFSQLNPAVVGAADALFSETLLQNIQDETALREELSKLNQVLEQKEKEVPQIPQKTF